MLRRFLRIASIWFVVDGMALVVLFAVVGLILIQFSVDPSLFRKWCIASTCLILASSIRPAVTVISSAMLPPINVIGAHEPTNDRLLGAWKTGFISIITMLLAIVIQVMALLFASTSDRTILMVSPVYIFIIVFPLAISLCCLFGSFIILQHRRNMEIAALEAEARMRFADMISGN